MLLLILGFSAKLLADRSRIIAERNRAEQALADLKKTAPGLRELAESEASFQRFDSALAKLDGAIAIDPQFLPAYWRRAWLLIGMERFGDAVAATRLAQQKDPANARLAGILPVLDQVAAAPSEAKRWNPDRATAILAHLKAVGAAREIVALAPRFKFNAQDKIGLIWKRLDEWFGKNPRDIQVLVDDAGLAEVRMSRNDVATLEPLRGLPIEKLMVIASTISSLEPLRGMPLRELEVSHTTPTLSSVAPLAGMLLTRLDIRGTNVSDLSPLKGMPLIEFDGSQTKIINLAPLAGATLRWVNLRQTEVSDLTPLQGAPLEFLGLSECRLLKSIPFPMERLQSVHIGYTKIADLNFLANAPVTELFADNSLIADLAPLGGKPLQRLLLHNTKRGTSLRCAARPSKS